MDEHDLFLSSNLKPAHAGLPPTGLMSVTAILLLTLAAYAYAATDTCAMVAPEDFSKAFGEAFGPPARVATPAGPPSKVYEILSQRQPLDSHGAHLRPQS